tara:strand:- start:2053 stop:2283 length:231 start_codon:yes stop_codon:yes gene_type:complete
MSTNAAELYKRIREDHNQTQVLFRQALQDPQGALSAICELGIKFDLPVTANEVKEYLAQMDEEETKQWVIKARGGL